MSNTPKSASSEWVFDKRPFCERFRTPWFPRSLKAFTPAWRRLMISTRTQPARPSSSKTAFLGGSPPQPIPHR
jgi:hypothetical protein